MRITIDTTAAQRHGGSAAAGIARYATGLTAALRRRATEDVIETFALGPGHGVERRLAWSDRRWRAFAALSHHLPLDLESHLGPTDVFIAADHVLPRLHRARAIFVAYDFSFITAPQTHSRLNRLYLRAAMPAFLRAADAVVAISESTRSDAIRLYGLKQDAITIAPPGLGQRFTTPIDPAQLTAARARYGLPERFALFVGTLEPRKNLAVVLRALARPALSDVPLVVAGRPGWLFADTERLIESLGLRSRVLRIGRVPDDDLPALYGLAEVFTFPSLYEGFGLPVLEALACGAPVIAADRSSLPEVVGDAGRLVAPEDVDGWEAALVELWHSAEARATLRERGPVRARAFSWDNAARRIEALCHDLL